MCKSQILFLLFSYFYNFYTGAKAGEVRFQRCGPEMSTVIQQKTAMPKDLTQTFRSLKGVISTEMLFVVS